MKRRSSLIESVDISNIFVSKKISTLNSIGECKMFKNTIWYKSLMGAEKSCLKEDKIKKVHYKFEDGREMVEEYNTDTEVLLRRAWKVKGKLGGEGKWEVEVGDPIPDATPNTETAEIIESQDQPILTRRNTRVNLEWRIRNLPYPLETYSISANNDEKCIIVRTTNKKYFKKLQVPEIARLGQPLEQANIQSTHQFNTLIIMYKKPQQLLDMDKEWFEELKKVKPIKDVPNDCKAQ
ncbi:protein DPCD isoform X1 [Amyelois transitella]|uniref:protein DPCD isoform X1 n=2 Tax=Amyelois transitella TaxID=680683 RepID=UPI0029906A95|nr:protein DPCD isoform X1 [Amyelois transitella]